MPHLQGKKKYHVVISIDRGEAFDKSQGTFMIKLLETRTENVLSLVKNICKMAPRSETDKGSWLTVQLGTGHLSQRTRQEEAEVGQAKGRVPSADVSICCGGWLM